MTNEPTTESLEDVRIVCNALLDAGCLLISDEDCRAAALNIDKMKGRAVDPLVTCFDAISNVEWPPEGSAAENIACALRAELAAIGWQVGPIETPTPAHPLTYEQYEQVIENCARLVDAWGFVEAGTAIRNKVCWGDKDRAFVAEYRRQTSALTTPVLTEDMVAKAWLKGLALPGKWNFGAIAAALNAELAGGRA